MNKLPPEPDDCIKYWRQSLVDSVSFEIKKNLKNLEKVSKENFGKHLSSSIVNDFFNAYKDVILKSKKKKNAKNKFDEDDELKTVPILLAPTVIRSVDYRRSSREFIPFWIRAKLTLDGEIKILADSFPVLNDAFIEPCNGVFSFGVTHKDVEMAFAKIGPIEEDTSISSLHEYLSELFEKKLNVSFTAQDQDKSHVIIDDVYIKLNLQKGGMGDHLLRVYSELSNRKNIPKLIKNIFSDKKTSIYQKSLATEKQHTGHVISDYPLNEGQKISLYSQLEMRDGDLLAVTGPPGTGKTTLIGNLIASEWVNAAIKQSKTPITLVTSTNNDAIKNALNSIKNIEAFSDTHPLSKKLDKKIIYKRWVQNIDSFGTLFPSGEQAKKKEVQNSFKCMQRMRVKGKAWKGWINELENPEELESKKDFYIKCAKQAFPDCDDSLAACVEHVHQELCLVKQYLDDAIELKHKTQKLKNEFELENIELLIEKKLNKLSTVKEGLVDNRSSLEQSIEKNSKSLSSLKKSGFHAIRLFQSKNIIEKILSIFSKNARLQRSERVMEYLSAQDLLCDDWTFGTELSVESIREHLAKIESQYKNAVSTEEGTLKKCQTKLESLQSEIDVWEQRNTTYETIKSAWSQLLNDLYGHDQDVQKYMSDPNAFEHELDTCIRLTLFHLAARYWEGQWLLELKETNKDQLYGHSAGLVEKFLRRLSKLTPCVAATVFMAPDFFRYFDSSSLEELRLFETIDLLIMDEAGQIAPEKGIAPLSLAKKAIIVGDTDQIEPIWGCNAEEDGLLLKRFALSGYFENMDFSGMLAHSGNIMKLAKKVSVFSVDKNTDGMFLSEHRRCLPEIIAYCNELVYKGRIIAKTKSTENPVYPAMGYAHIPGASETKINSASRFNVNEAEVIAQWVYDNKQRLIETYGDGEKTLGDIIGIVTPFSAQTNVIVQALQKLKIQKDIRVGTLHTFQGAERELMIFSSVYGGADEDVTSYFFDISPNMLNVAVSRAKQSFLVFGDMRIFARQHISTPSGLLAKYLFSHQENELHDIKVASRAFSKSITAELELVDTLEMHRQALNEALTKSQRRLLIESAYLSINALEQDNVIPLIQSAKERGVECRIIYDVAFNQNKEYAQKALLAFKKCGIKITGVRGTHCKTLAFDDEFYMNGSFNWLSAQRNEASQHYNKEKSWLARGPELKNLIDLAWDEEKHAIEAKDTSH